MKKYILLLALPVSLFLSSCGGETKTDENNNDSTVVSDIDYTGMSEFDLEPHGLMASMMVTDIISENGSPFPVTVVCDTNMLTWDIKVGKEGNEEFYLIIEETDGEGNYIKREKDRLASDDVFKEEYLTDENDLLLYKASLPEGTGQRDYYHVFGLVKIGKLEYIVHSYAMGDYSEVQARDMLKGIQSLREPSTI